LFGLVAVVGASCSTSYLAGPQLALAAERPSAAGKCFAASETVAGYPQRAAASSAVALEELCLAEV
jgi:hypothetical protein